MTAHLTDSLIHERGGSALLNEMQEKDIIQQSNSPWGTQWALAIASVTKKENTTGICMDNRKLNEVTRQDAYPCHILTCR